ncbi:MAG: type III pantothenate kinase [Chitinivibrionales bacterium]|nr:type III pantothenate kinase [Chitinivibrionales bacterium]
MLTLSIDIGNTVTAIGLIDTTAITCLQRRDIATGQAIDQAPAIIDELGAGVQHGLPVKIASVVPEISNGLRSGLRHTRCESFSFLVANDNLPVKITYETPPLFGSDRLANMLYAHNVCPGRSSIVIDAGTAVTVDILKDGSECIGGCIFPGPALQFAALKSHTAQLPHVKTPPAPVYPGASTQECIYTGVIQGVTGAIERIAKLSRKAAGEDAVILATGGVWPQLAVAFEYEYIRDLTLIGTALYRV